MQTLKPIIKRYAVALILLCLPACANTQTPPGDRAPDPPPTLLLEFTQSGGLAGIRDHLIIMSDGACTVERKNTKGEYNIEEEELISLHQLLKECYPDPPPEKSEGPFRAGADYLTYTFKTQVHDFSYTDMDMPERIRKVVDELNTRYINKPRP